MTQNFGDIRPFFSDPCFCDIVMQSDKTSDLTKPVIEHYFDLSTILQVRSHPKSAKQCYGQNV